jgi:uncharacterized protein YehS (DUF1456 family)
MDNNDIFRRLRYSFNLTDKKVAELFELAQYEVTPTEIVNWLKKDDDPEFKQFFDKDLAAFLNGVIIFKRGKKEGEQPKNEKSLNNNAILRKLKIALTLNDDDMLDILAAADQKISKHELSAFFRKPDQSNYKPCGDQILRRFLMGLQIVFRGEIKKD